MDQHDGWQRLWILAKWLIAIGAGLVTGYTVLTSIPIGEPPHGPDVMQIFAGSLMAGMAACGVAFGLLEAFEWVYRGFKPLPGGGEVESVDGDEKVMLLTQRSDKRIEGDIAENEQDGQNGRGLL